VNNSVKKTRSARGAGRLYKRTKEGKEISANSKAQGVFWLQYTLNGKRVRHALTGLDGKPITDLRKAEAERKRLTAPLLAGKREDQLDALTAALNQAENNLHEAKINAEPILTVSTAWDSFLNHAERNDGTGERTLSDYKSYWNRFEGWLKQSHSEIVALWDVSPNTAKEYADHLRNEGLSANTYNKNTSFIKNLFDVLNDADRPKRNPFANAKNSNRFRMKENTCSRRELTIAELRTILTSASGDLQTLLALGTFTGLRLGDCCTLKWGEIDLDRGLIRRIPNKTARKNKTVLIGIPAALRDVLELAPIAKRQGYVLPEYAAAYQYVNANGSASRRSDITKAIQKHFIECGIQTHKEGTGNGTQKRAVVEVGFHSLRHTYVSLHAEKGTPQALIQGNVGHSNPAMTQHYLHVNEETAFQTAQVLSLDEPQPTAQTVPPWIVEKLQNMNAKNWKQIKSELIGYKRI
jgi:integrase